MTYRTFQKVKYHCYKRDVTISEFDSPFFRTDPDAQGAVTVVSSPGDKNFWASNKGGLAKNLYIKSESLIASCRGPEAWSERVNLYTQRIIIVTRQIKVYTI
jgi:hypothetical protein